jgi:hypothetical protein
MIYLTAVGSTFGGSSTVHIYTQQHSEAEYTDRNIQAHSSFLVRNFLEKNERTVVPQPHYSPDLTPADFFLFLKLKSTLKGLSFDTFDEIQKNSTKNLFGVPESVPNLAETLGAVCC